MPLFADLIKPALDSVTALISQFHMSPEEKAQAQQAIADASQKAQLAAQDYDVQLNAIAGQNIRAEAQSGDSFTMRARPSVIWMGNLFVLWNWGIVPLLGHGHTPANIPDAFWWTWGTVVTGYVFSRGAEKIATLPGDSQVNLAGIVKIGNKS